MTTEPQKKDPTKAQRRLASRRAVFDAMMKRRDAPKADTVRRPGSVKK